MATIQKAIKEIIELKGLDIFKDSKQFFACLDDLSPEYQKERRMIKKFFDDELLKLFIDDTKKVRHRLRIIKDQLEDFGFTEDKIYFIIESFGIPLGWGQEILDLKADSPMQVPSFNNQPKNQNQVNVNVTDVSLNDDVLKQWGFTDKNSIPTVLNIPSTYKALFGNTYRIVKIDDEVFKGCDNLQSVTIPDTVTEIGKGAFEGCSSLQKVNISNTITKIGDRAFANCKLLNDIVLPNSLTDIGKSAFGGCFSLKSLVISNRVTKISEGLFGKCKSLVNINIPNGVTEIGDLAFAGCESLNSLLIPKTVTKIGSRAFANCKSLESILIPNSVTNIVDQEAFGGCVKLQQFTLPTRFTIFKDYVNKQIDLTTKVKVQQQSQQVLTSKQVSRHQSSSSSNPFVTAKVGDVVKFGNYPQTANGGIQPIEWQVLSKENNKMLVISKYGLETKRFDSSSNVCENSEIRSWLNGEFYNKAFTYQEKKYINFSNLSDVGTTDNIFLLSKEEAEKYFADNYTRRCKATDYAVKNGAYVDDGSIFSNGKGYSFWWLRSPSPNLSDFVYYVSIDGYVYRNDVYCTDILVRPALFINL